MQAPKDTLRPPKGGDTAMEIVFLAVLFGAIGWMIRDRAQYEADRRSQRD